MYGYLRPLQGELKVRELERFKACYCGLCHALGEKYGIAARFVLSYELVFLAMLLWDEDEPPVLGARRCIASPCMSKRYCERNDALDICAGYNVILTWWKLRDAIADERFFAALPHRLVSCFLHRAYKKAASEFPSYDKIVRQGIKSLQEYESQAKTSLDGAADKFARILKAAAPEGAPEGKRRPLHEMLYHLGRWIYLIDACDDYGHDAKAGRYNPILSLYPPHQGKMPDDSAHRLKTTITHSNNLLCSAFELMPENTWTPTVKNMIYLGMPDTCMRVLDGSWRSRRRFGIRKNKKERNC